MKKRIEKKSHLKSLIQIHIPKNKPKFKAELLAKAQGWYVRMPCKITRQREHVIAAALGPLASPISGAWPPILS